MLLTEEEYNKKINFRTKQVDNSLLAMKFHNAVRETIRKIFEKERYYIYSILDGKTKVKMENKEYSSSKTYPSRRLTLEFIRRFPNTDWYSTLHKKETQYFKLDANKDIESYLDVKKTMHSWDERYYKDFIKFTSLQSKSFKKKLIKVVYIFENEQSDKKYRKIFNFLVNYFRINIKKQVHNYDETTKKPIDETKLDYYTDTYYLTDFKRILEPKENRNRLINKILKSNDLVDNNN